MVAWYKKIISLIFILNSYKKLNFRKIISIIKLSKLIQMSLKLY